MKNCNSIADINEYSLKELKEKILKNSPVLSNDQQTSIELINAIASIKGYLDICPFLTLKTINQIIQKKHEDFRLVKVEQLDAHEGAMAMEFDYIVVFRADYKGLLGVKLRGIPMIDGELWDDYVANEANDVWEVKSVKEKKRNYIHN